MRLLVFGGGSQVGRELAEVATGRGHDFVALNSGQADIRDVHVVRGVVRNARFDLVVNLAAYTKVDLAESHAAEAWLSNCKGPAVLAQECAACGTPLLHMSTDYVFDGNKHAPYVETDPVSPLGVYGASKEAGERAVRERCEQHVILRTAWVYGRYGNNFLKTMLRLSSERDSWGVVADQIGNPTATPDLAEALLAVALRVVEAKCSWGTYHFAGTGDATWYEFARTIVGAQEEVTARRPNIKAIRTTDYPTPARRPANSRLNSSLFVNHFGYQARPWKERVGPIVRQILEEGGPES
jgi:dTDP-4-dehydrorhamnose reductase